MLSSMTGSTPEVNVKQALRIYRKWNLITSAPKWGGILIACTCKVCFPNCVCQCTVLLASLFNPDIRVLPEYIPATVSLRKQCRSLQGTAGRKRMRLLEEAKCNEKTIDSKVYDRDEAIQASIPCSCAATTAGETGPCKPVLFR